MELLILVVGGVCSTSIILAFCIYVYLANNWNSYFLYTAAHDALRTKWHTVILGLSAIALLFFIYYGVVALLWWMPNSWGTEALMIKSALAFSVSVFGGLAFLLYLAESLTWKVDLEVARERAHEYEHTLKALRHPYQPDLLKREYEDKISKILDKVYEPNNPRMSTTKDKFRPEFRRVDTYRRLIDELDWHEKNNPSDS